MRIITYFLVFIIIFFGITFAVLNSNPVSVNYYVGENELPLSWLLAIAFAIGCLVGILVGFYLLIKANLKNYRLRQRLSLAEKEIENLRAIPLQDNV